MLKVFVRPVNKQEPLLFAAVQYELIYFKLYTFTPCHYTVQKQSLCVLKAVLDVRLVSLPSKEFVKIIETGCIQPLL